MNIEPNYLFILNSVCTGDCQKFNFGALQPILLGGEGLRDEKVGSMSS